MAVKAGIVTVSSNVLSELTWQTDKPAGATDAKQFDQQLILTEERAFVESALYLAIR